MILLIGLVSGYFLSSRNKSSNSNPSTVSSVTTIQVSKESSINSQKSEIENLKKEVEQLMNTKPKTQLQIQPDKLPQSLLDDILQQTVLVICSGSSFGTVRGSGSIQIAEPDQTDWYVFTNAHVVLTGPPDENTCVVGIPAPPNYNIVETLPAEIVDVNHKFPDVDKAVLLVSGKLGYKPLGKIIPACKPSNVLIGDKVTVVGYPAFGGWTLTATEGIVSGFENTQYGLIYKTSAKIDSGNSGGIAIDNSKKCSLGIPSWATQGTFEGLGYVQSWDMISSK